MTDALQIEPTMTEAGSVARAATTDPRILRTRDLLSQALVSLLESKEFDKISVQDITDAATVNRATFYAHYPDKFALLECMVAHQFNALLAARGVVFDGTCTGALCAMMLGVCDFLIQTPGTQCERQRQLEPHVEAAVVTVVRGMILEGLKRHPNSSPVSPEMRAATVSGAIYNAAKEWARTPQRTPSESFAATIVSMVTPILHG